MRLFFGVINMSVQNLYTVYAIDVVVGCFYWLRKRGDSNLKIVKVVRLDDGCITVNQANNQVMQATIDELLYFDPDNRLFKCLMNNPVYRHDNYIKKILQLLGYSPEIYMVKTVEELNTFDADISENAFYTEYGNFVKTEDGFCDEMMLNIREVVVTGTHDLTVYSLYKIVCANGGMERVTNDQKWKSLFYSTMSKTNVSYTIRTSYKKYLYEFEIMRRKQEDDVDYQYKFTVRDRILIAVGDEVYYGTVKLRRNRGLNQYYIQFYLWSREKNEWFCEDKLKAYMGVFTPINHIKRRTRSSKANNLIDDPLTREKHSHKTGKVSSIGLFADNSIAFASRKKKLAELANGKTKSKGNAVLETHSLDFTNCKTSMCCDSDVNLINTATCTNNLNALMGRRKMNETAEVKSTKILDRTTSKRKQKTIKMLQGMGIMDESGKMTEDNYMFLSFFNL